MGDDNQSKFWKCLQASKTSQAQSKKKISESQSHYPSFGSTHGFPTNTSFSSRSVSTMKSIKAEESFCNINDYIKVDTPTAEHVKQMALTGPDPFLSNLFDTNSTLNLL